MKRKKILHTADWHLGKRLLEYSRLPEQIQVMDEIVSIANSQQADVVVIAGDLFDVFQPSHEAQELFYKTLFRLCSNGTRPVIAIAGNHDSHALIEAPLPLSRELGIFLMGADQGPIDAVTNAAGIVIHSRETGIVQIDFPDGDQVDIIAAPYANEVLLRTWLGNTNPQDELRWLLSNRWKYLAEQYFRKSSTRIFVGHFFFMQEGGEKQEEPEGERSILHVGGVDALYTDDLPDGLNYAALGHLHRFQTVDSRRFPVVYSSSPLAYSFSEAHQDKYVVIFDAEEESVIPIKLSEGYPLVRKRFESFNEAMNWLELNQDYYVELTLQVEDSIDSAIRSALYKAHPRIVHLIPERKGEKLDSSVRVGAADMELTTEELFKKYFLARNGTEVHTELLDLFREVVANKGGEA